MGGVPSTRLRRPLKLIYFESYISKSDALRREEYFKTTPGKRALKLMLRKTLNDLKTTKKDENFKTEKTQKTANC
jgi:predicted GIY-YIG superfamily endonuclease